MKKPSRNSISLLLLLFLGVLVFAYFIPILLSSTRQRYPKDAHYPIVILDVSNSTKMSAERLLNQDNKIPLYFQSIYPFPNAKLPHNSEIHIVVYPEIMLDNFPSANRYVMDNLEIFVNGVEIADNSLGIIRIETMSRIEGTSTSLLEFYVRLQLDEKVNLLHFEVVLPWTDTDGNYRGKSI